MMVATHSKIGKCVFLAFVFPPNSLLENTEVEGRNSLLKLGVA